MEIVHFAPYSPNASGLYEAARDMVRADTMRGHLATFVDVGATLVNGVQQAAQVGAVDDRAGFRLVTAPPEWADTADLLVYHTGASDNWVARNQAPIVWMVHGRPLASFRPEQNGSSLNSYTLYHAVSHWPRVKKLVYFWPEFTPHWEIIMPAEKLAPLDWPPVDLQRFTPDGPAHVFQPEHKGRWNALICDSWRPDVDVYEVTVGAIEAAKHVRGLKVHFYSMETAPGTNVLMGCWDLLTMGLRRLGALGELSGRSHEIIDVYRAVDFVLTPNRIATRIVCEALACGVPVIAPNGSKATPWTCDVQDPSDVAYAVEELVAALADDRAGVRQQCLDMAQRFGLERYGKAIERVYQAAVTA